MKNQKIKLLIIGIIISKIVFSQTVLIDDDFDSYTVGTGIASQSSKWETWSSASGGNSEDALASDNQAQTAPNSMHIVNDNDMIYRFGDISTGKINIKFNYYITSGNGGYLNIEHVFAKDWAFELWFTEDNKIIFDNGQYSIQIGTFTSDTWHELMLDIDLSNDSLFIYLEETIVDTFAFSSSHSYKKPSTALACINFYGLSDTDYGINNSDFFIDNFKIIKTKAPKINVNITEIVANENDNNKSFTITNNGEMDMDYRIYSVYNNHSSFSGSNLYDSLTHCSDTLPVLAYKGQEEQDTVIFISRFYPEQLNSLIGLKIDSIRTHTASGYYKDSARIMILNRGKHLNIDDVGTLLYEETYRNISRRNFHNFPLSTPFTITGEEISFGLRVQALDVDSFLIPVEYSDPAIGENQCNFIAFGNNPNYYSNTPYNIYLKAYVSGYLWPKWLSISSSNGIITGGNSQDITITFNTSELKTHEKYTAKIVIVSNDRATTYTDIPVTLDIASGINNKEKIGVISYPNPTHDFFYITADKKISDIKIYSTNGQLVFEKDLNTKSIKIELNNLPNGIYNAMINIDGAIITKKIMKN